jgi:hypothetical protein
VTPGDANLRRIHSSFAVLSGVPLDYGTVFVQVRNMLPEIATIGVYLDVVPPGGTTNPYGCAPSGRLLQTTVTLDGTGKTLPKQTNVFADTGMLGDDLVEFSCADHAGAFGKTYTLIAAVDVNADDAAFCSAGNIQSLACYNALADDDTNPTDNRATRNAPKVQPAP